MGIAIAPRRGGAWRHPAQEESRCKDAGAITLTSLAACTQASIDEPDSPPLVHLGYYSPREFYRVWQRWDGAQCQQWYPAPALPVGCGCTP